MLDEAYDAVLALADLRTRTFKTPSAGNAARPFKVLQASADALEVQTSKGGRVSLRMECFEAALKVVGDLAVDDPDGWIAAGDETLVAVLQSENRDKACSSYVLPLLEAAGLLEVQRTRPARVRLARASG